jgi:hypothetical protein
VGSSDGYEDSPDDMIISVTVKGDSPSKKFPSERLDIGPVENKPLGHVFFYTPIKLLEVNFDGVVDPLNTEFRMFMTDSVKR